MPKATTNKIIEKQDPTSIFSVRGHDGKHTPDANTIYENELFQVLSFYPGHVTIRVKSTADIALNSLGYFICDTLNCLKEVLQTPFGEENNLLPAMHLFSHRLDTVFFNNPTQFSTKLRQSYFNKLTIFETKN